MVLTEEQQENAYPAATLEPATITTETGFYGNLTNTQTDKPGWFNDPLYNTNTKTAVLKNASGSQKIGPNMILKVMAGDSYNIRVASGWQGSNPTNGSQNNILTDLFNSLTNGIAGSSSGKATLAQLQSPSTGISNALNTFLGQQGQNPSMPKAYIGWILFDEQFKIAKDAQGNIVASGYSGFEQVGASGTTTIHVKQDLTVLKSGYLYIYTSNESDNMNVYFDNLQVTHTRGAILEETHYYPFGLPMAGISSKAAGKLENKKKFNGIEYNTDFDINTYDAFYRTLDPQIGRFLQIDPKSIDEVSPYSAMMNNPILMTDPLGDTTNYYDTKGNILYTTNAKGYNNAFIVGNDYLDAAKAIFGSLGELDLDQQKAFDGAVIGYNNLVGFGDAYDVQSINQFYDENVSKNPVDRIGGVAFGDMKNLKIDGKSASPDFFKGMMGAEASFDMVKKNGVWTVDKNSISTQNDLSQSNQGSSTNPNGHLHPNVKRLEGRTVEFQYQGSGGVANYYNKFTRNGPPSGYGGGGDIGIAKDQGKVGTGTKRNVVVNYSNIYFYSAAGSGPPIPRR